MAKVAALLCAASAFGMTFFAMLILNVVQDRSLSRASRNSGVTVLVAMAIAVATLVYLSHIFWRA